MSDVESLYRAILAAPGDDTLRLVYADAVEESGDEARAAFVREQVELARLPFYDAKQIETRHAFLAAPDAEGLFADPLPDGIAWARNAFRRGLPGAVRAHDGEHFVLAADELFTRYPIESLDLNLLRLKEARDLGECSWLVRVCALALEEGAGAQAVARLFDSPYLTALTDLRVGSEMTTPAAVAELVRGPAFPRLKALAVRNDRRAIGTIAGELARYTGPARLEKLDVTGNRIVAEALAPLLAGPALERVAELNLTDNHLGQLGSEALAAADLSCLGTLRLDRTRPGDEGVAALARAGFLPTLRALSLVGNNLSAQSAVALANGPLRELRSLRLFGNRVGDRGAEALAGCAALSGLLELDLNDCLVGDAGALALAASPHLGGLLFLGLMGQQLGPRAAGALRERFGERARFKPA